MPTGNVLHRVVPTEALPGRYWHVYPHQYDARSSNPNSTARLAWRDGAHGMFYTGASPAAAPWETVLRYAEVNAGVVSTSRTHLEGMALAQLTLGHAVPALDLRPPFRRQLVDAGSALDGYWDQMLKEPDHDKTHVVTDAVMRELQRAGHPAGAALIWHSRQAGSETATLFFEPPMQAAWWTVDAVHRLDTHAGHDVIAGSLDAQGLVWRGAAVGPGFDPPAEIF